MSNHIAGNWFVSVFKMQTMLTVDLEKIVNSENYRYTTRRNAQFELDSRKGSLCVPTCEHCGSLLVSDNCRSSFCDNKECKMYEMRIMQVYQPTFISVEARFV